MRLVAALLFCLLLLSCGSSGPRFTTDLIEGEIERGEPHGWMLSGGGNTAHFACGLDRALKVEGEQSATLYSTKALKGQLGTLNQTVQALRYAGKRVRLRGQLRHVGLEEWAGLWMRADSQTMNAIAFDNMRDRKLQGSGEWQEYEVVLDIPGNVRHLTYGVLMIGRGQVWVDDLSLEVVGPEVARTGVPIEPFVARSRPNVKRLARPANLGFEE